MVFCPMIFERLHSQPSKTEIRLDTSFPDHIRQLSDLYAKTSIEIHAQYWHGALLRKNYPLLFLQSMFESLFSPLAANRLENSGTRLMCTELFLLEDQEAILLSQRWEAFHESGC